MLVGAGVTSKAHSSGRWPEFYGGVLAFWWGTTCRFADAVDDRQRSRRLLGECACHACNRRWRVLVRTAPQLGAVLFSYRMYAVTFCMYFSLVSLSVSSTCTARQQP